MTKLEQKLIELGYRYKNLTYSGYFFSRMYNEIEICLFFKDESEVSKAYISTPFIIETQQQIDNLQQAFNQLQNDLKELKEYE